MIMAVTGVIQAFSVNYELFTFFGFLNAVGTSGVFPLAFIIGNKKNDYAGLCNNTI